MARRAARGAWRSPVYARKVTALLRSGEERAAAAGLVFSRLSPVR